MARELDQDELIDRWTLVEDELASVAGRRGATRLGFALLLRFYTERGRFPRGRGEIPGAAVDYVARQVGVPAAELAFYDWSGRTIKAHRVQIRRALRFRECSVADADKVTEWLVANVTEAERSAERVREKLLARFREERIEPPTGGRIDRIVRSALHRGEELLFARVVARLPEPARARLFALVAAATDDDGDDAEGGLALLASIRSDPGSVSLNTMLTEIAKLQAVRAVGLPDGVFADIAPKVVTAWRARAAVEAPSHLRDHPPEVTLTLLAALLYCRKREITDTLVELLISTVHRINARAEVKVTKELIRRHPPDHLPAPEQDRCGIVTGQGSGASGPPRGHRRQPIRRAQRPCPAPSRSSALGDTILTGTPNTPPRGGAGQEMSRSAISPVVALGKGRVARW